MESLLLDAAGHRRSPATMPGYHAGRSPRNKGLRYPADPPTVEEIVAVMRSAGDGPDGARLRALIVILWRAGLRISEALDLAETDLDSARGAILVRCGRGGKRREVGMDRWAWSQLQPWLQIRAGLPRSVVVRNPRCDRRPGTGSSPLAANSCDARPPQLVSVDGSRRISCGTLTRSKWPTKVPLVVIQRQLGHANLGITSIYLQGIDPAEIIDTVHSRPTPVISATAGLRTAP